MKNIQHFIDGVKGGTIYYQVGADSTYDVLVVDQDGAPLDTRNGAMGYVHFYTGTNRSTTHIGHEVIHFSDIHKGLGTFFFSDIEDMFTANTTYYMWVEVFDAVDGYGYGDGYSGTTTDVSISLTPSALVVG